MHSSPWRSKAEGARGKKRPSPGSNSSSVSVLRRGRDGRSRCHNKGITTVAVSALERQKEPSAIPDSDRIARLCGLLCLTRAVRRPRASKKDSHFAPIRHIRNQTGRRCPPRDDPIAEVRIYKSCFTLFPNSSASNRGPFSQVWCM
jgi:hypothetical protein